MENMLTGFCKGFGGLFGVIAAILLIVLIAIIIVNIVDKIQIRKELPKMLLEARNILKQTEQYEQLTLINKYKKELKKNQLPKEVKERFSVEIKRYIKEDIVENGSRLSIAKDRILKYTPPQKIIKNNKKKDKNDIS